MSELISQFHFIRPAWLLLMIPALSLGIYLLRQRSRSQQWEQVVAPHLLPFLIDGNTGPIKRAPAIALLIAWLLGSLAMAGPTWQRLPQPLYRESSALVLIWDLSPSMLAEDVKPSRLVRARLKLIDLLKQRKEGLTALIAYSGEAHVVTPLTDDTETIISLLHGLDPGILPSTGSNAEMALELANQLLKDSGIVSGDILYLTDGIDKSAHAEMASLHDGTKHTVSVWGIGSAEGAPIPLSNGGFAYDRNRQMVIARLNDDELSDIATELGGIYIPFSQTESDLEIINSFVLKPKLNDSLKTSHEFDQWREFGPTLILMVLPFAVFAFRKGWLFSILAIFTLLPTTQPAYALGWNDLWKTKDQQAYEMIQENPQKAANLFKNKDWKAIANYKSGNYQKALEGFDGVAAEDHFNRGTALTHLGQYDAAIEEFSKALEKQPEYAEAKNNLKIAEQLKALAEAEQQKQDQNQGDGQADDQNPSDNSKQSEQSDSQQSDSQQADSQQANPEKTDSQQSEQQQSEQQQASQDQQNQNSQQNDSQQANNDQQDRSEQQQTLNEKQQKALQEKYANQSEKNKSDSSNDENTENKYAMTEKDEKDSETESDKKLNIAREDSAPQDDQEREQQQSLQQWLRKVPDNPSGLLRNKFQYEHYQRNREFRQKYQQTPGGDTTEERW